jgi:hypothetical protein
VVVLRRHAAAIGALGLAAALACGAAAVAPPTEVVDRYFRFLARDPIRTLPLLTPGFHERHGLHVVTSAEARWELRGGRPAPESAPFALDRYQLAWLTVQSREAFAALREELAWTLLDEGSKDDRAWVRVRVQAKNGPPFEQRFSLVRSEPGGLWRIDAVEQIGVGRRNRGAAFVAWPSEAARRQIEEALRGAAR